MKELLFHATVAICLLPILTFSQEVEWQNTIGGSNSDGIYSIQQTTDKGYILGGTSYSGISGDKTENGMGNADYWIVKLDSAGSIQWQNTIGGNYDDGLRSIHQTADGGFILGGSSESNISGDKTENSIGTLDYWVVKTDAFGIIQWENTIGGSGGYNDLTTIQEVPGGGYILGGTSNSYLSGDKTENSMGGPDYWIVKLNSSGVIQWQNTIGGINSDKLTSLQQTSDGGYILAGHSSSSISGDKTENLIGYSDYWIVKLDATGTIQWQNTIGGSTGDYDARIHQTFDGGYIVGGRSDSNISGDKTENSAGLSDYWVVKLDATGNIQWQNTLGGNRNEDFYSIIQTTDGGYLLGGQSQSDISLDKTENSHGISSNNEWDFWIVKLDTSGNIQWQNTIGASDDEYINSIQQTVDEGYILGGYSNSNISGDKTENSIGSWDFWVVKLTANYNLMTGKLFLDLNSNNIHDTNEPVPSNKKVTEINNGRFGFSNNTGKYDVSVLDTGTFSVSPVVLDYYSSTPLTHTASFTSMYETDSLNDFAFQPLGVYNDLCVTITPLNNFRPGYHSYYRITFENVGTTTLTPTVLFFPDNDISFVYSVPGASSVTTDSIVWNFGPLDPHQQSSIFIQVNVNIGIPTGTLIHSEAKIEPLAGDANTLCNQAFWDVLSKASYDPNDIIVDEDTLQTNQFPNPPYLEYIIRFQNTGNDTAFTVKIINPIDTLMLDLNSFEFVSASHQVTLSWIPWEKNMQFQFDNILLPDSIVNEPESHGFVRYRIKPKSSLILGDTIANYAAIYFDFNVPVITNTEITRIVFPNALNEIAAQPGNLLLYPNPANAILTIKSGINPVSECQLLISDVAGRTLFSKSIMPGSTKHTIDISSFCSGIYFVQLHTGGKIERGRFVKE